VNRGSLFARIHQFATSVYGPLMIDGLDFWLGRSAPYWGHNAIIRVAPFMKHCRLPRLPGREPLGGDILSHDFVEAALMRAAGWDVRLAPDLGGSYEESPANLVAHAVRERRWCQGNLQHLRLVFAPKLVLASRLTLAVGAISYLCGPAWVLFVMALSVRGTVPAWAGLAEPAHPPGSSLDRALGATLMGLTLVMLFMPKLLALIRLSVVPRAVALRGGWRSVAASVALEGVFAILVTPILVTFQTVYVLAILAGRNAGWGVQARGDADTDLTTACQAHGLQTACGLAAGIHFYATGSLASIWLLPSLAGLWLAIPLSIASSRADWGARARGWGLFLIPEEIARPPLLEALTDTLPRATDRAWPTLDEPHAREAAA
jgi:membrane glycosyltransferase